MNSIDSVRDILIDKFYKPSNNVFLIYIFYVLIPKMPPTLDWLSE